jgi:hypothetical protein
VALRIATALLALLALASFAWFIVSLAGLGNDLATNALLALLAFALSVFFAWGAFIGQWLIFIKEVDEW